MLSQRFRRPTARFLGITALLLVGILAGQPASAGESHRHSLPTVVLVHGAWADGSSWSKVVRRLQRDGYPVVAGPNPLRGLDEDSAYLRDYLETITGPIVLVGHSYGGSVITNAATGNENVTALVYVDAFIPDIDQSALELAGPDSALAPAATDPTSVFKLVPFPGAPEGVADAYVLPDVFVKDFANGLPRAEGRTLAAVQPPTSVAIATSTSGEPAWKTIPSWDLIGTEDRVIPPAQQFAMARNAGSEIRTVRSGHLSLISHPGAVTRIIEEAARATSTDDN